ncbi:transposase [Nocardioides caricicola]|uniref:Transposase n=1 Tax=Nocardioides caricicola TaxID=634770 RepID=A0ABW0MWY9_9ACTN
MPAPHPPEFRRRALDLARQPGASVAQVAKDLGISESGLRRWIAQDDVDSGRKEGLSTSEREELVRLRRENRRQQMEIEILKRASAYFAQENVLPE